MKNVDKIKMMPTKEFAHFLGTLAESSFTCSDCPVYKTELYDAECCREYENEDPPGCWYPIEIWLDQEVDKNAGN
jgi:hypothetical protein